MSFGSTQPKEPVPLDGKQRKKTDRERAEHENLETRSDRTHLPSSIELSLTFDGGGIVKLVAVEENGSDEAIWNGGRHSFDCFFTLPLEGRHRIALQKLISALSTIATNKNHKLNGS